MKNWLIPDREQLLLLQPSIADWVPENHLARFVAEVAESLDLSAIEAKYGRRQHGSAPYHPALLTALLFYGYATGTMSSRKIERATYDSVPFRFIAGGHHPDHTTLAEFRRVHLRELSALFLQILMLAREMGMLKVGTVALDGTKIKANASKHAAVSWQHAKRIEKQLRAEIAILMKAAEGADNTPLADGIDIPAEIARRQDRLKRMEAAKRAIAERAALEAAEKHERACEEHLEKTRAAVSAALEKKERPPRVPPPPEPPSLEPGGKAQHNFTDPESRIMPDKGGFSQAYNAQLSVDTETMLAVGHHLSQNANDRRELLPALSSICRDVYTPHSALADAGYFSAANIAGAPGGIDLFVSPGREKHRQPLAERLGPPSDPRPGTPPPPKKCAINSKRRLEKDSIACVK